MSNIYQSIWDADLTHAGVHALKKGETPTDIEKEQGYVFVDESGDVGEESVVLSGLVRPPHIESYTLAVKLFDNYVLSKTVREETTTHEAGEESALVAAIFDTPPMQVARGYIERYGSERFTDESFKQLIHTVWFRLFSIGSSPSRSGFEHVFVGEQSGGQVGGYHWWYKYLLDDGREGVAGSMNEDRITYLGTRYDGKRRDSERVREGVSVPEVVTLSNKVNLYSYEHQTTRPLYKKIGGFFVGPSVEGLMAMGLVRAHIGASAPKYAVINGARYDLKLYRSPDNRSINTFYPVFTNLELASGPPIERPISDALPAIDLSRSASVPVPTPEPATGNEAVGGDHIRIMAALINPEGNDEGREQVTLLNVTDKRMDLTGWRISGNNGNTLVLIDIVLPPGTSYLVPLPKRTAQLTNKGGVIRLHDKDGTLAHQVSYERDDARAEGRTVVF